MAKKNATRKAPPKADEPEPTEAETNQPDTAPPMEVNGVPMVYKSGVDYGAGQ